MIPKKTKKGLLIFIKFIPLAILVLLPLVLDQYKMNINLQFLKLKEEAIIRDQRVNFLCEISEGSFKSCNELMGSSDIFSGNLFYRNFKNFFREESIKQKSIKKLLSVLFYSSSIVDQSNYAYLSQLDNNLSKSCLEYNKKLIPLLHYLSFGESSINCPNIN